MSDTAMSGGPEQPSSRSVLERRLDEALYELNVEARRSGAVVEDLRAGAAHAERGGRLLRRVVFALGALLPIVAVLGFSQMTALVDDRLDRRIDSVLSSMAGNAASIATVTGNAWERLNTTIRNVDERLRALESRVSLPLQAGPGSTNVESPRLAVLESEMSSLRSAVGALSNDLEAFDAESLHSDLTQLREAIQLSPEQAVALPLLRQEMNHNAEVSNTQFTDLQGDLQAAEARFNFFLIAAFTVGVGFIGALVGPMVSERFRKRDKPKPAATGEVPTPPDAGDRA